MSLFAESELKDITGIYQAANTPASLYRALSNSPAVQRVAEFTEPEAIQERLAELIYTPPIVDTDLAEAYAVLVASLLKKRASGDAIEIPEGVGEALTWAQYFEELAQRPRVASFSKTISVVKTEAQGRPVVFGEGSNTNTTLVTR